MIILKGALIGVVTGVLVFTLFKTFEFASQTPTIMELHIEQHHKGDKK